MGIDKDARNIGRHSYILSRSESDLEFGDGPQFGHQAEDAECALVTQLGRPGSSITVGRQATKPATGESHF
jgi:hypothetical protein